MISVDRRAAAASFIALGCVGFLVSSSPVLAQDQGSEPTEQEDDQPRLGGVTVTDTAIDEPGVRIERADSPKYVVPLLDTPQTITVIGNQTIREQNLLTLRDALTTVPGITFGAGEGGGGYGDSINLRGQSLLQTGDIMIDGMRDTAQYSRSDTFNVEQIEVINGPNSVYAGAGSVAGGINIVSKRPKAQSLTVAQGSVGTDEYFRGTIDTNLSVGDGIAVRVNAMAHRNDVPGRDVDKYERWGFAPSIAFGIGRPTQVTLQYLHQVDDNTPQYGVPYYKSAFYDGPLPGVHDSNYYGYANIDYQEQLLDRATIIVDHQFSDMLSLRNLSRWQHVDSDTIVNPPQGGTFCLENGVTQLGVPCVAGQVPGTYYPGGPRGTARFQKFDTLYNQLDLTLALGGGHRIVLGASYLREDFDMSNGNVLRSVGGALPNPPLDTIDISDPDPIYTGPTNYIRAGAQKGRTSNAAAYVFTMFKLTDRIELNAGARIEQAKARFRQDAYATPAAGGAVTPGAVQHTNDTLFSYRVGLVYKPVEHASLYVAYGNSRNPTSTSVRSGCGLAAPANLGNDPCSLSPEKAVNYEVGGKIDLFDAQLQLTAALFRNERGNFRVASNDPLLGSLPVNDGRSRTNGIALGAAGNISEAWAIFANYTYLDTKVQQSVSDYCLANPGATTTPPGTATPLVCPLIDPQAGNPLINTPKHAASLFTTYTLPFGLQLGYGLTYQGDFYLNNARTTPTTILYKSDSYVTHRLFASYPITDGLTAQINIQNVTDKRYFHSIRNNGWALPGEGRQAILSLFYSL